MENDKKNYEVEVDSNKKKTIKNYVYNVIYQTFLIIVPLIVTPYISRVLTTNGVGKYSFSYSLITYFTIIASLGFGYYAQRLVAKYQNDKSLQSKCFWEIIICRLFSVFFALSLNIILCLFNVYSEYNNLMWIFSINILAVAFDISFFFQGNEDFGKLVFRNVVIKTLSIICIFLFIKNENDLWIYVLINCLMNLISNLSMWTYLPRFLCSFKEKLNPFKHLKGTLLLFVPTIAVSIYTILDKTLIGLLVQGTYTVSENGIEVIKKISDLENGYYEQSEKIVKMLLTIIACIGTVMIPRNSNEMANGNFTQVKKNIALSYKLVLFIGLPMSLGLCAVASNFVPWFLGEGYDKCIELFYILSPLIVIMGLGNVFAVQYLIPTGQDKKYTIGVSIGAIINLTFNCIFIPLWWSKGAAIATLIAESCVTISMMFMVRKEINLFKTFCDSWKIILSSCIMFAMTLLLSYFLNSSVVHTVIIVLTGIFVYFISLFLLREDLIIKYIKKIKK